jgi:6-phosphogluconolactonase
MNGEINHCRDLDGLSQRVAEQFVQLANQHISQQGSFYVALAGGGTPKSLYRLLASAPYRAQVEWSRVFFFFGDERYVPHDNPDSNYHMAWEYLLAHVPVDQAHVFAMNTALEVRHAAADYSRTIQQILPVVNQLPAFDLILLGMGDDGHTASLFPRSCILHDERLVAAVYVEKFKSWRISMTYPLINNAEQAWILVAGSAKAPVLARLQSGQDSDYPVAGVKPRGKLVWYVDQAAAAGMTE